MDNVKLYECFPTRIYEFKSGLTNYDNNRMIKYLTIPNNNPKEDDLHMLSYFKLLKDKVLEVSEYILNSNEYEYEKIEITNMWANQMHDGGIHAPHTHSNNFLS